MLNPNRINITQEEEDIKNLMKIILSRKMILIMNFPLLADKFEKVAKLLKLLNLREKIVILKFRIIVKITKKQKVPLKIM